MAKVSGITSFLLRAASAVEAFRGKEERQALSFQNFQQFFSWINEGQSMTDEKVNPVSGTKLTTVFNCLNILGQDVASLAFNVRQHTEKGIENKKDALWFLINKKPNRYETAWNFWYGMIFMGEGWGNSYAHIRRDGVGNPVELTRLAPWRVEIRIIEGDLFYVVDGTHVFPPREIFHYRSLVLDSPEGYSKIVYNANQVGLKIKQTRFAEKSTGNMNSTGGYLTMPNAKQEQRDQIIENWTNQIKRGMTPLLFGEAKFTPSMLSPEAAQIVEQTEITDLDLLGIWRMQPVMVSRHKDSNYSNAEQQTLIHSNTAILPIVTNIEQEANDKLLSESKKLTYETKFDLLEWALRTDAAGMAALINALTTTGHINSDEVREKFLDMPPQKKDGKTGIGEIYYQQGAMTEKGAEIQQVQQAQRFMQELEELKGKYKLNGHTVN